MEEARGSTNLINFLLYTKNPNFKEVLSDNGLIEIRNELEAYKRELEQKSWRALFKMTCHHFADEDDENRFFNSPDKDADFEIWGKFSYLSPDQAIALSFGKEPSCVYWKNLEPLKEDSLFVQKYYQRLEGVLSEFRCNNIEERIIKPIEFIRWSNKHGIIIPSELEEQIIKYNSIHEVEETHIKENELLKIENKKLNQKNKELQISLNKAEKKIKKLGSTALAVKYKSLQKIGIGTIIFAYKQNPLKEKNSTTKDILNDLRILGIPLDDKTILTHIAEAYEELKDQIILPEEFANS